MCLGALVKGRSSSPAINALLKRSLGFYLGADFHEGLTFFKSGENPADDGTRGRETRSPCQSLPDWFVPLARGEFRNEMKSDDAAATVSAQDQSTELTFASPRMLRRRPIFGPRGCGNSLAPGSMDSIDICIIRML